jgi:hypothetical protein
VASSCTQGNETAGNLLNKIGLWIGNVTTLRWKFLPTPESSWAPYTLKTEAPPNRRHLFSNLHGVTPQNTCIFITAVIVSYLEFFD